MLINRPFCSTDNAAVHRSHAARARPKVPAPSRRIFRTRIGRSYGMLATQAELLTVARETMEHKVRELDPKREKLKQASTQACEVVP